MKKIRLIIEREYMTRVKKKSFLWMTIIGPVLFAAMMVVPVWLAKVTADDKVIEVVDENGWFTNKFPENKHLHFIYFDHPIDYIKKVFLESKHDGLLYIPKIDPSEPQGIIYYTRKNTSLDTKLMLEWSLRTEIENIRLSQSGIDPAVLQKVKTTVNIDTVNLSSSEEENKNAAAATAAGFFGAILIYLFIFLYGMQVMRGVIEEKSSRIIEVIITSIKPMQLMLGKIIGIALVALTQFLLWIILTGGITTLISSKYQVDRFSDANITKTMSSLKAGDTDQALEMNKIISAVDSLHIPALLLVFVFYFMGGYLLYAALFASIGAAVDSETDTQQFMLPVTIPLVLSFVFAQTVIQQPDGTLAFWLSVIPFTSPIIMMVRVPFGVPLHELLISMSVLIVSFVTFTWMASRIYRVGILMYGKKASYKEIVKWMRYK